MGKFQNTSFRLIYNWGVRVVCIKPAGQFRSILCGSPAWTKQKAASSSQESPRDGVARSGVFVKEQLESKLKWWEVWFEAILALKGKNISNKKWQNEEWNLKGTGLASTIGGGC